MLLSLVESCSPTGEIYGSYGREMGREDYIYRFKMREVS